MSPSLANGSDADDSGRAGSGRAGASDGLSKKAPYKGWKESRANACTPLKAHSATIAQIPRRHRDDLGI
jgi:hypothetical protein